MSITDVRVQVPPRPPESFPLQEVYTHGRVVELVDSLDSGSSVHYGRAGSSPASPTKLLSSSGTSYLHGRVVELVDSLDSGSSVHYGRAGSSPASPTMFLQEVRFN